MMTKNIMTDAQAYCPPEFEVLEFTSEGVLCYSPTGSTADDVTIGGVLDDDDFEQIF